jgi:hypothetical protein
MELILAHWWQFTIIVIVLVFATYVAGKSAETILVLIKETLLTLARETLFKTASSRAASINVIMLIFSGILAIALVIPNILVQLGLKEESESFVIFLGVFQFLLVGGGSGYGIYLFEKTLPAFMDDSTNLKKRRIDEIDEEIDNDNEKKDQASSTKEKPKPNKKR